MKESGFCTVELQHVYRQTDTRFLSMLNRIRTRQLDDELIRELNARYRSETELSGYDGYIRLMTHNHQAQKINKEKLEALAGSSFFFDATVSGVFPELSYAFVLSMSALCCRYPVSVRLQRVNMEWSCFGSLPSSNRIKTELPDCFPPNKRQEAIREFRI